MFVKKIGKILNVCSSIPLNKTKKEKKKLKVYSLRYNNSFVNGAVQCIAVEEQNELCLYLIILPLQFSVHDTKKY